jgi:hypothetical protein
VQLILENLFPRKISLMPPEDADDVVPELIAFWHFLKREYQFKNADATLKYLKKLQPRYRRIMNDSSRFGMAKSFMTAGIQAGFDMTTQKGLTAFQLQYNANLMGGSADSPLNTLVSKLDALGASAQSRKTKSQGKGKGAIASEKGFGNDKGSQKRSRKKK